MKEIEERKEEILKMINENKDTYAFLKDMCEEISKMQSLFDQVMSVQSFQFPTEFLDFLAYCLSTDNICSLDNFQEWIETASSEELNLMEE